MSTRADEQQTRTLAEGARVARPPEPRPTAALARGATVGRFVVLDQVGAGGMGTVYAAWDPQLSRRVALKVLRPDSDATERARTLREARALAQSSHPNVVRVFELGEVEGAPFIAMELVDGSSLRELLQAPLPEQRLFALFDAAGRGLAAVHALGIVHRDFKPGNIFVGFDGRVCIGDFGLAIASSGDSRPEAMLPRESTPAAALEGELTQPGLAPGTPAYMAPEQLRGEPLDARADQFAFAVAHWYALYGVYPYGRDGCLGKPPPATPTRRSLAGRLVEPVLRRALAFEREQRYADVPALLDALLRARQRPARAGVALGAAATVAAFAVVALLRTGESDPCGVRARAAAALPDEVRARLRAGSSPNPLSDVGAHVGAYLAQWQSAAAASCGREDATARAAAEGCLDRRLGDLAALAAVLAARGESVETALPAVLALPGPASCLSTREVAAAARHGDDATLRALERRLSDARAAHLSGRPRDALALAREVAAAARASGDARLEAEAEYVVGLGAVGVGELVEGERALRAAIAGAMLARAERLEAEALIDLLSLVGDRARRFDEALRLIPLVRAAAARLPEDVDVQAHERFIEAIVLADAGDLTAARPVATAAVVLAESRVPRDPRAVSRARGNLGNLLASLGEVDAGLRELEAARRALEGALPAKHTAFGAVANNLGLLLQRTGDPVGAKAAFEEAERIFAASPGNPSIGVPLDNLATLAREQGQPAEAKVLYARARGVFAGSYGPQHERTAAADLGLALVAQDEGHFDEAARRLDEVARLLEAQNAHSRPTLEALLARATLAFEASADEVAQARAVAAVQAQLTQSEDLRGVRAELALLEAARAVRRRDLPAARAALAEATAGAGLVRWRHFPGVVAAWAQLAEGRPVACAALPPHVPLARALRASCR